MMAEVDGEAVLKLLADAAALLREWEAEIEAMLAAGGQMEIMRDWGAKLAGATLRLAVCCIALNMAWSGESTGEPSRRLSKSPAISFPTPKPF